ncbi:MAG: ABC transporter ATP-binding protein [Actinomycetales bacterium]|nr:ABC transporter ATP-binding protein [Actinomycetales bacterium]
MSVQVKDLKVYYRTLRGDVRALDGASFTIADGEIMGLAGESGCGKSTLGRSLIAIDGRMRYVGGSVSLDGAALPLDDQAAMARHRFTAVSLVPQYAMSAMNPTRKIGKLVTDLLRSRGIAPDTVLGEFRRRLELVGLSTDVLARYPIELSGGMKQRVVMVISTLLDPSLLVADEITSALDVSTQKAVAEAVVEFRDRGFVASTIVITHDLSILVQMADSIMIMYAGKPVERASTDAVVSSSRHPYTRLLLSSLPEVGVRYEEHRLSGIAGRPPSLLNPPPGCRFRDRCPLAFAKCAEEPPFVEVAPGHSAACWKA